MPVQNDLDCYEKALGISVEAVFHTTCGSGRFAKD
jgi:hypothetical protein